MQLPVKPICPASKIRKKDGTSIIFLQYCYNPTSKTLLDTGIAIPPQYWDNNKNKLCIKEDLPAEHGKAQELNDELDRLLALTKELIKMAKRQNVAYLGQYVKEKFSPTLNLDALAKADFNLTTAYVPEVRKRKEEFFDQLDKYVESKQNKVKPATITVYQNMIRQFEAFEKHRGITITFNSLDFNFYDDFVHFLTYDYQIPRFKTPQYGLKVKTIGKTIKQFRVFIKDRVKRRIIPPIDLSDYKIPEEESDAVYLTYAEIEKIYRTDLSEHPELIPYRALFVLACLTGLRFSDFSALRPEDLHNNMLYKKQEKSSHWVVIPLRQEAKEIFTEQFKEQIPKISNAQFNENIKLAVKLAGISQRIKFSYRKGNKMIEVVKCKYNWVTSHTARRSFCTNEFLAGTPVYLIMKISGHKREKDFYKYIRVTRQEAAERIKKLWGERQNTNAFNNLPTEPSQRLTA